MVRAIPTPKEPTVILDREDLRDPRKRQVEDDKEQLHERAERDPVDALRQLAGKGLAPGSG